MRGVLGLSSVLRLLYLVSCIILFTIPAYGLEVPKLTGYVNDYAGMISPQAKTAIEQELLAFEQSDSTQIVILTIPSLQGEVLDEYSIKVAEAWKIGQKGKDNGVIFLISKDDRKMRIEVGRGLEGPLTDLMAGRIIDLVITPKFKTGDFDGGFIAGISALIDATRGEFNAGRNPRAQQADKSSRITTFLFFGAIAILIIGSISRIFSGITGAVGLPAFIHFAISPVSFAAALGIGIFGLIAGLFLPTLFLSSSSFGGSSRTGGYGGSGGLGGFGGGGFGSGGFGGGGGGFGGGGASGGW